LELHGFFDQYLRTIDIPIVQYKIKNDILSYRFKQVVQDFSIPIRFYIDGEEVWLTPSKEWKTHPLKGSNNTVSIDENFYIIPEGNN